MRKGAKFIVPHRVHILSFDEARRERATRSASHSASLPQRRGQNRTYAHSKENIEENSRYVRSSSSRARRSRFDEDASTRSHSGASSCRNRQVADSHFSKLKKDYLKNKAGRSFERQFGSDSDSHVDAGPRAAVYKGQMGTKHRQAARMQNSTSRSLKASRFERTLSRIISSTRSMAGVVVAVCLVLSCVSLYPAAQQCYQEVRERDRLEVEYKALSDRNATLESEVNSLQTDSGVELYAHEHFGWVNEGEETANVRGLSIEEKNDSTFQANIASESIEMPQTWYSPFLDVLFGVK